MGVPTGKELLWASLSSLMEREYGRENLTAFARKLKLSPGHMDRFKKQDTSVGLDILDTIAEACDVQAWQLLVPGFDARDLPKLAGPDTWPALDRVDRTRYEALSPEDRAYAQAKMMAAVEEREDALKHPRRKPKAA